MERDTPIDAPLKLAVGQNNMKNDFKNKSDAELIQIINASDFESKITTPMRIAAKIELHERQKKDGSSIKQMTLWILIFTIALVVITLFLVFLELRSSVETNLGNPVGGETILKSHDQGKKSHTQQNQDNDKNRITHTTQGQQVAPPDRR